MSWESDARCREHDPDLFFAPRSRAERRAKAICARCPVRAECLAYALQTRMEFGIWGGMTGSERRRLAVRTA